MLSISRNALASGFLRPEPGANARRPILISNLDKALVLPASDRHLFEVRHMLTTNRKSVLQSISLPWTYLVGFLIAIGAQFAIPLDAVWCQENKLTGGNTSVVEKAGVYVISGKTMGPIDFSVTIAKSDRQHRIVSNRLQGLPDLIDAELDRVNRLMSTYREDSDVSRFNRHDDTDWFDVSPETAYVVKRALEISEQTSGYFDITVAPLVNLWNFGPTKTMERIPTNQEIETALDAVGFQKLSVRTEPPGLAKSNPVLQIDLSAIAKGYAVDLVSLVLTASGVDDYFVEVGGEVFASGKRFDGSSWTAGVLQPNPLVQSVRRRVPLSGQAMATSGDYQNFYQIDEQTFSHTIDPKLGRPVTHRLTSVSVVAKDCLTADALATAILAMGPEGGIDFCKSHNVPCYLLIREHEGGGLVEHVSTTFPIEPTNGTQSGFGTTFLGTLLAFVIVVLAMAVGVIFGRKRIQGSCGGIASLQSGAISPECSMCSRPTQECSELKKAIREGAVTPTPKENNSGSIKST